MGLRLASELQPGDTVLIDLSPGSGTAYTAVVGSTRPEQGYIVVRLINVPPGCRDIVHLDPDGLVELEDDEPVNHSIPCRLRLTAAHLDDHRYCGCICHELAR